MANKPKIEQDLSRYLGKTTIIDSVHYIAPCFIILKNVKVLGSNLTGSDPLSIERITLVFSLKEIITSKNIVISKIYLIKPRLDFYEYPLFLRESIDGIVQIINLLAQGRPLKIVMEDSQYILRRNGNRASVVLANTKLKIGPGFKVASVGEVNLQDLNQSLAKNPQTAAFFNQPIRYRFFGTITPMGFIIETLDLESGKLQAGLKGNLKDSILSLKGHSTIIDFYKDDLQIDRENKLVAYLRNLMLYKRIPQKVSVSATGLNILDIDCLLRFESKNIFLEQISFNVNNVPLRLKGAIAFLEKTSMNLSLSTFYDQDPQLRKSNPQSFDVDLACVFDKGKIDGKANVGFLKGAKNNYTVQIVKTLFDKASFGLSPDNRIKLFVENILIKYKADEVYDFKLSSCELLFNFLDEKIKFIKFSSELYDGSLKGHFIADVSSRPVKASCSLKVDDVAASQLETVLLSLFGSYRKLQAKLASKINGRFACDLEYASYPVTSLRGNVRIKNGYLDNVRFFLWLSEFFNIPSLSRVDFSNLSANFEVDDHAAKLDDIDLTSSSINLKGDFLLKNSELLNSRLSITIARQLLAQSPKFQLLLALMKNDTNDLNFSFQLSGLYESPNFKWLESDFKDNVKKMLPNFIERGIEKNIERAINSISEN